MFSSIKLGKYNKNICFNVNRSIIRLFETNTPTTPTAPTTPFIPTLAKPLSANQIDKALLEQSETINKNLKSIDDKLAIIAGCFAIISCAVVLKIK